ncbi:squalene/phytoene synthase family protein [Streptomyces sp. SL13]|uniref:Squalene/phytoene synthase family protein n=1 Tax=Streptantibioticus silvisoli TaxID=2705255 RepID=A0AA90KA35_9ACTN|nr:squalene/phytoene synthase family protein [Streptantibioticus silvisoli]MDI5966251.1 squalene/phytoene synthase family protein [Streptantibioticus silvisoli]MDI5971592.1 squalene/phytoene synthase family protein [Streptantibioticus silvisoli]
MGGWHKALDAAGISDVTLRGDYTAQRELVTRFRRELYLAARLLLPPALLPDVVVAIGYMHHTDGLLDRGPKDDRARRYRQWEAAVRAGLSDGSSDDPLIRALSHSVTRRPALRERVETHLATATTDLEFTGFDTEADYQGYLAAYSLPSFMLVAGLLEPDGGSREFELGCRTYIDGAQRLDFVNDLAEDLADGRLMLSAQALRRFGVDRDELEAGEVSAGVRRLLSEQLALAREQLARARVLVELAAPDGRHLVRALIGLDLLTLRAAALRGGALLRGPAHPPRPEAVALLTREWVRARHSFRR